MKFLIIEDHALFRHGLLLLLAKLPGNHEFVEVENCEAALAQANGCEKFDLVLLDLSLPGMNGLEGLARLRAVCPTTPVVLMSANENPQFVLEGMRRGAQGFIPKSLNPDVMLAAMQVVLAGGTYVPLPGTTESAQGQENTALTARQREVLALLVRNMSNKEIADALGMRVNTVRVHVAAILKTLGVESRTEAARMALSLGLVSDGR